MKHYVAIVGMSGSGKSYFRDKFLNLYGGDDKLILGVTVKNLKQVTTRAQRADEPDDAYKFITEDEYTQLSDHLIARTTVSNRHYGTLDDLQDKEIGFVIVNPQGARDLLAYLEDQPDTKFTCIFIRSNQYDDRGNRDLEEEAKNFRYLDTDFSQPENAKLVSRLSMINTVNPDGSSNIDDNINFVATRLREEWGMISNDNDQ